MSQFIMKNSAVFRSLEVALGESPVANGFCHPGDQLANTRFPPRGIQGAVQILAGDDVGRGHRPIFGDLDISLLENHIALGVGDLRRATLPFDVVVRRGPRLSKKAAKAQPWCLLAHHCRTNTGLGAVGGLLLSDFRHFVFSCGVSAPYHPRKTCSKSPAETGALRSDPDEPDTAPQRPSRYNQTCHSWRRRPSLAPWVGPADPIRQSASLRPPWIIKTLSLPRGESG